MTGVVVLSLAVALSLSLTFCETKASLVNAPKPDVDRATMPVPPRQVGAEAAPIARETSSLAEDATVVPVVERAVALRIVGRLVDVPAGAQAAEGVGSRSHAIADCPIEIVVEREPEQPDVSHAVVADAAGDFSLELMEMPRSFRVLLGGGEYCRRERIEIPEPMAFGIIHDLGPLAVRRGVAVRGVLLDAEGKPAHVTEVELDAVDDVIDDGMRDIDPVRSLRLRSDAEGRFAVDGVVRIGRWRARADLPTADGVAIARTEPAEIVLAPSLRPIDLGLVVRHQGVGLRGIVRDESGRPVGGVRFELREQAPEGWQLETRGTLAWSDAQGRFVLTPRQLGSLRRSPRVSCDLADLVGSPHVLTWGGSAEWRLRKSVRRTRLFVRAMPGEEPIGRFDLAIGVPAIRTAGLRTRSEEEDSGLGVLLSPEVRGHGWIRVAPIAPQFTPTGPVDVDFDLGAEVRIEVLRAATARVDVRRDHRAAAGVRLLTTTPGTDPSAEPTPPQWWFLSPRDWFVPGFTAARDDAKVGLTVSSELGDARVRLASPDRLTHGFALLDFDTWTTFEIDGDSHRAIAHLPPSPPRPFRVEPDPGSVRFALRSRGGRRIPSTGWLQGGRFELPLPPPGEWHLEFDALGEARSHVTSVGFAPRDSYAFDCRDRLPARIEIRKPGSALGSIESEVRESATSIAAPAHRRLPVGAAISLLVAPGTWTITLDRGARSTIDALPGRETIVRLD